MQNSDRQPKSLPARFRWNLIRKSEGRMSKSERNPKSEIGNRKELESSRHQGRNQPEIARGPISVHGKTRSGTSAGSVLASDFEILSDFGIRMSDFIFGFWCFLALPVI